MKLLVTLCNFLFLFFYIHLILKGLEFKEIRKKLGYTQIEMGKKMSVTRKTIGEYEKSDKIPNDKAIFIEMLLEQTINNNSNTSPSKSKPIKNSNGNKFVEKEDGTFNLTVDLMPFEAYASYTEAMENAIPISDFEEVTFNVDQFGLGNYKAFKVKGDSMNGGMINDTPDNTLVLTRELGRQHWIDGFNKTDYGWIILSKHNIFHKDITGLNKENGTITCHSRNQSPEYSDFELKLNDIYQIFKVIKRTF
ncbi:XRE family transcriptional regulator [Flavicella sediminum]|uniref:XRE family transcriptional regulator n=1 Tax=Flavicella sediminum TaxID=2585141 RepID=UPI0021CF6D47|nr:XRE family transcriptional regulator [Flavicella sediminum]